MKKVMLRSMWLGSSRVKTNFLFSINCAVIAGSFKITHKDMDIPYNERKKWFNFLVKEDVYLTA